MLSKSFSSSAWDVVALDAPLPNHLLTGSMRHEDFVLLGKGGKAEVFKCRDCYLGREVAYKVLHQSLATRDLERRMLVREARITAALGGNSVPAVHEIGIDLERRPFFTMELVEGKTLKEIIDSTCEGCCKIRESLGIEEFLAIVAQVAKALGRVHQLGVVHADIKPENILVSDDGKVTIIDWGIARIVEEECESEYESIEQTWGRQGSALFMSPEQASREKFITPSADIYSLGAVLYECLTSRVPIIGKNTEETLNLISTSEPDPPSTVAPDRAISKSLNELCMKALAKHPEDRFASMVEFDSCITQLLQDRLICFDREDPSAAYYSETLAAALAS